MSLHYRNKHKNCLQCKIAKRFGLVLDENGYAVGDDKQDKREVIEKLADLHKYVGASNKLHKM